MSILLRIARFLGYDTTTTATIEKTLNKYTVEFVNGDKYVIYAHGRRDGEGGTVSFYAYGDVSTSRHNDNKITSFGPNLKRFETRSLGGIQEVGLEEEEKQTFTVKYDRADRKLIEKDMPDIPKDEII